MRLSRAQFEQRMKAAGWEPTPGSWLGYWYRDGLGMSELNYRTHAEAWCAFYAAAKKHDANKRAHERLMTKLEQELVGRLEREDGFRVRGAEITAGRRLEERGLAVLEDNGRMRVGPGRRDDGERWWLKRPAQPAKEVTR